MSQVFIRCPHCNFPHGSLEAVCPVTGKPMHGKKANTIAPPPSEPPSQPPRKISDPPRKVSEPPAQAAEAPQRPSPPPPSKLPQPGGKRSLIGTLVAGTYLIKDHLSKGGMAILYEAEHVTLGRPVAIKVLPLDRVHSDEAKKRFLQEARASAALSHRNICQVFDFGTLAEGNPYIVMELLHGEPLSERIAREGGLQLIDVVNIGLQVLSALSLAHKKGIVHRDVKPENVFLVPGEEGAPLVKLLDFGLAKLVAAEEDPDTTQLTQTGFVMGTPFYLAPEQATGNRDFDARVDLWATGVVLHEAITGRKPFTGANWAELVNNIVQKEPRPVSDLRPSVPYELDRVLARALSKNRDERYSSANDFMRGLLKVRHVLLTRGLADRGPS